MSKITRYVVTERDDDCGYDFCHGVYDTEKAALGEILSNVLDVLEDQKDNEITVKYEYDTGNNDWFDVIVFQKENQMHQDITTTYRVYILVEDDGKDNAKTEA